MINVLPELLTFNDRAPVTADTWGRRRKELYEAIVPHEYGGLPPQGEKTAAIRLCASRMEREGCTSFNSYEIRVIFPGGDELLFMLNLWIPALNTKGDSDKSCAFH